MSAIMAVTKGQALLPGAGAGSCRVSSAFRMRGSRVISIITSSTTCPTAYNARKLTTLHPREILRKVYLIFQSNRVS